MYMYAVCLSVLYTQGRCYTIQMPKLLKPGLMLLAILLQYFRIAAHKQKAQNISFTAHLLSYIPDYEKIQNNISAHTLKVM